MVRKKVHWDEVSDMVIDEDGRDYTNVDWKADPEDVLEEINKRIKPFNLQVTMGDLEPGDDQYYFRVDVL